MNAIVKALSLGLVVSALLGSAAESQNHRSAQFEYHESYYEQGYHNAHFRYHAPACERRRGGLGLGVSLGGSSLLSANLGSGWTECDRGQLSYASSSAYAERRTTYWENPETGRRGVVKPENRYRRGARACFSGEAETYDRNGDHQRFEFESCQDGSGGWSFERRW